MSSEIKNGVIIVPKGVRYVSEWKEYNLSDFNFPHILDKKIPGCGYTEYCLTNPLNVILCSPRRILLENKESQHLGEVFYFKPDPGEELLSIDKNLQRLNKSSASKKEIDKAYLEELRKQWKLEMEEKLTIYILNRLFKGLPVKIIVTYDSFGALKSMLMQREKDHRIGISSFYVVVDEFQSIFVDSKFKSETEMRLLGHLGGIQNICFVSATPMIDKYLKAVPEFSTLPYFEFDWETLDPGRTCKPSLEVQRLDRTVNMTAKKIIQSYKNGKFKILPGLDGKPVQSTEAVFYVNSVTNITQIINLTGLQPNEVNILCAKTPENISKIRNKLGKKYEIGNVPLKGEHHKMFTFCTRTVYLGADFYSRCARSFILSDANIESLAVDISLDLPQILGRQRLLENPWKNHAEFYYKPLGSDKEVTFEAFNRRLESKLSKTNNLLAGYIEARKEIQNDLAEAYEDRVSVFNYKDDYVAINTNYSVLDDGTVIETKTPVMNTLVMISEQRAFDIQQIDYKDRFTVFNAVSNTANFVLEKRTQFVDYLRDTSNGTFKERLRELCETIEFPEEEKHEIAREVSESFDKYYNILGPERCKACGYLTDRLNREIQNKLISRSTIKERFLDRFKVGSRYTRAESKETIKIIYSELGLEKSPKASDLEEFFELRTVKILDPISKKKDNGFEIIGIK